MVLTHPFFMDKIRYFGKDKGKLIVKGVAHVQMVSWKKVYRRIEAT